MPRFSFARFHGLRFLIAGLTLAGACGGRGAILTEIASKGGGSGEAGPSSTATRQRRVIFFYTPHGTLLDAWRPTGSETNFQLSPILAPLEAFKSKLIVLDGIDNLVEPGVTTGTYDTGPPSLLTGRRAQLGMGDRWEGAGPSLDVALGKLRITPSPFDGVHVGIVTGASGGRVSWSEAGQSVLFEDDPTRFCQRVLSTAMAGCPQSLDATLAGNLPAVARLQIDNLVQALALGRTRFGVVSVLSPESTVRFDWLASNNGVPVDWFGLNSGFRDLANDSNTAVGKARYLAVQTWFAQQFSYLLGKLAATPDGDSTLLEKVVVVWLSETGEASQHAGRSIPVVLAGGLEGALRTGRFVRVSGRSQVDLLQTIALAATADARFGDPTLAGGILHELLAP